MIVEHFNCKCLTWDLIYQATKHGFDANSFWNKCNNISNVIVVIETATTGHYVFGGYTSTGLIKYKQTYKQTKDGNAFLYSLRTN
eukprot:UN11566